MASIYIHIPFCKKACFYCDFHFSTSLKNKAIVTSAIAKELVQRKSYLNNKPVSTVYFGGGTPSILSQNELTTIIDTIKNNFRLINNIEMTLEANPEDISQEKLHEWESVGINRISLGVQSFHDKDLAYMNRAHNSHCAEQALELITQSNIQNINVDLIYGFPILSDEKWKTNLKKLIKLSIPHISCYCITVEKNTALYHLIRTKKYEKMSNTKGINQFIIAHSLLESNGYEHYEISNFSRNKFISKHNTNYWNRTHYLGIGPSAHSFNGFSRQWNINNNNLYSKYIMENTPHFSMELLSEKDIVNEYILTKIRGNTGINLDYLEMKMSRSDFIKLNKEISKLIKINLMCQIDNNFKLTLSGMLMADKITSDLFII